jgi:hypothetical protein
LVTALICLKRGERDNARGHLDQCRERRQEIAGNGDAAQWLRVFARDLARNGLADEAKLAWEYALHFAAAASDAELDGRIRQEMESNGGP